MVWMSSIDKTGGLLVVHFLGEVSMKKGVGDVHLMHRPRSRDGKVQNSADRARFDNRGERVREVNAGMLMKATDHPARLL